MEHKHRSVSRAGRTSSRFGTVIVLIISIVLIAGIIVFSPLGSYLMEHIISPILSCVREKQEDVNIVSALKQQEMKPAESASPVPTEKKHEVIMINEVPFYILQMGAFTNEEDAKAHADQIMRMGAGGVVYEDGQVFRVFAAAYTDESSLAKVQSQVRSDGFEATPYITESKAIQITLDGDKKAVDLVSKAVKLVHAVPSDLCGITLAYDKGEILPSELLKELQKEQSKCMEIIQETEKINTADVGSIIGVLQKYVKNISTFLGEHDTMDTEMISARLKHLQLTAIVDYILFFDQK